MLRGSLSLETGVTGGQAQCEYQPVVTVRPIGKVPGIAENDLGTSTVGSEV